MMPETTLCAEGGIERLWVTDVKGSSRGLQHTKGEKKQEDEKERWAC